MSAATSGIAAPVPDQRREGEVALRLLASLFVNLTCGLSIKGNVDFLESVLVSVPPPSFVHAAGPVRPSQ